MTFYEVLTAAIADLAQLGYDSEDRVEAWMGRLRVAAEESATPAWKVQEMLGASLGAVYQRMITRGGILKYHPDVTRFTLSRLDPRLRGELNRRIHMSANLIKLNRENMVATTLQRFSGWASSIPAGGSEAVDKRYVKRTVGKALQSLPMEERRVAIDQSHKLSAAMSEIIATDSGAIAVIWHSHFRQPGYDYREDHKDRDGEAYVIRGSWAHKAGLITRGDNPYYDEIDGCGQAVYCRCFATYISSIQRLPDNMLTAKGRAKIASIVKG